MEQRDMRSLTEHDIKVQLMTKIFPELQGMLVEPPIIRHHVV